MLHDEQEESKEVRELDYTEMMAALVAAELAEDQKERGTKKINEFADNSILSKPEIRKAQRSGVLRINGKRLLDIPEPVFHLNEPDLFCDEQELLARQLQEQQLDQNGAAGGVPQPEYVSMLVLDLSLNNIAELPASIELLSTLTTLELSNNDLTSLPTEIGALQQLETLKLQNNYLHTLPASIFTLCRLKCLDLNNNEMKKLHVDLTNLTMLETLDVGNNMLKKLPDGIGYLVRLTHFSASHNNLSELPEDFGNMRSLCECNISENSLKKFPNYMYMLRRLRSLYAQQNHIYALPDFTGCADLEILNFHENLIKDLPAEFCAHLPHLKVLDLGDNRLVKLPENMNMLQNLTALNLAKNQITALPVSLGALTHLVDFKVEGNPIQSMRRDVLSCGALRILRTLREQAAGQRNSSAATTSLNIAKNSSNDASSSTATSQNQENKSYFKEMHDAGTAHCLMMSMQELIEVPPKVFQVAAIEGKRMVDLSKNRLPDLPAGIVQMREVATELCFANNLLGEIPSFIAELKRVHSIDFCNNKLHELPDAFGQLSEMRTLNISTNCFESLPKCVYQLTKLEVLLARDNRINKIDASPAALGALPSLRMLDLRNNDIRLVPPILGNLTNITMLDINGNPFRLPRQQILDKGTTAIMSFLRNRIPSN